MTRRRVLLDGNGSTKINVEGLVVYVPAIEHDHLKQKLSAEIQQLKDQCNAMQVDLEIAVKTAETLKTVTAERDQLAAQVEALKHGVYHFNRSHGDLNPLLKAVAESPKQCLSDIRAKAIRKFVSDANKKKHLRLRDGEWLEFFCEEWLEKTAKDGAK